MDLKELLINIKMRFSLDEEKYLIYILIPSINKLYLAQQFDCNWIVSEYGLRRFCTFMAIISRLKEALYPTFIE